MKPMSNIEVYGLKKSIKGSKYPMSVDLNKLDDAITPTVKALGKTDPGTGHCNFLKGIVVRFDLTFTNKAWVEAERYHWFDIVSSQSTMHRMTKFDPYDDYIDYVDTRVSDIMKELIDNYNIEPTNENYLKILYTNPSGMLITADMVTNYLQLKTIYHQRKTHRLPEWQAFCNQLEELPLFKELVLGYD